jgi:hypothetical protein
LIECEQVLVPMLPAAVALPLAIKQTVLWVWAVFPLPGMLVLLAIQCLVLVVVQLPFPLYRKQILPLRCQRFAFLGAHFKAPIISLNSRLYSLPEYEAG